VSTKYFKDFHNIHKGENIVVCGCGTSLLSFKEHHSDFITIGVNDVPGLFDPTYMLVTDNHHRFNNNRKKLINESKAKYLFTCVGGWSHPNIVYFTLGKKGFNNLDNPELVDHFLNSPYTATNVAYKLGAKNIGIIGVDFTDGHFYNPSDGQHSLDRMRYTSEINFMYGKLSAALMERGVMLFNLSKDSKIDSIPYISIEDFKKK
jgi:hypothetical protein